MIRAAFGLLASLARYRPARIAEAPAIAEAPSVEAQKAAIEARRGLYGKSRLLAHSGARRRRNARRAVRRAMAFESRRRNRKAA